MFVPCTPLGVPPVVVPRSRVRSSAIERSVVRSRFATKFESGGTMPLIPSFCSSLRAGSLKRSSQTTSLASSRSACSERTVASPVVFDAGFAANVSASPSTPLTRSCSASTSCWFWSRRKPGGLRCSAAVTFCRSCSATLRSFLASASALTPGVISAFATAVPSSCELWAIVPTLVQVVLGLVVLRRRRARLQEQAEEDQQGDDDREEREQAQRPASGRAAGRRRDAACRCRGPRGAAGARESPGTRSLRARPRRNRIGCRRRAGPSRANLPG